MKRETAILRIRDIEPAIRELGANVLYLFGSTARDEATAASDVDMFVALATPDSIGFIEFFDLEALLEKRLGTTIDLTTQSSLHSALREAIDQSAIRFL